MKAIDWDKEFTNKTANEMNRILLKHYEEACDLFVPLISINKRILNEPYMKDELKRLKHELWHINKRSKWLNKNRVADFEATIKNLHDLTVKTVSEYEKNLADRSKHNP
jgi:hypothetical protein